MKNYFRSIVIVLILASLFTGCFKKAEPVSKAPTGRVELVYYKLYDEEDVIRPLIQQYQATHPNVIIKYRKFENPEEYYSLILNELAEGEGPDIFSVPNYWLARHTKKLTPMPPDYYTPQQFDETFVTVASKDALLIDPRDGQQKVFGLPLGVDVLALYYNKDLYDDRVPERGRPAATWDEFKDDVFKLTKADNSFERFEVAGTAMGRADNISRSLDILYTLMLQYKTKLYNDGYTQVQFANQQATDANGVSINPAVEALRLYTSFGLASQQNYSWNQYISDSKSDAKEVGSFARGKVATIFGYSYHYQLIQDQVAEYDQQGVKVIDPSVIRIAPVPQVNDPATSTEKRDVFANYFLETVSRTTEHPQEAWDFLIFMTTADNLRYYNEKTNRPTSRRDLIQEQIEDPIYGVFAEQVGFAESFIVYDWDLYTKAFTNAINDVLATISPKDAVKSAQDMINVALPDSGIFPPVITIPLEQTEEAAQ